MGAAKSDKSHNMRALTWTVGATLQPAMLTCTNYTAAWRQAANATTTTTATTTTNKHFRADSSNQLLLPTETIEHKNHNQHTDCHTIHPSKAVPAAPSWTPLTKRSSARARPIAAQQAPSGSKGAAHCVEGHSNRVTVIVLNTTEVLQWLGGTKQSCHATKRALYKPTEHKVQKQQTMAGNLPCRIATV